MAAQKQFYRKLYSYQKPHWTLCYTNSHIYDAFIYYRVFIYLCLSSRFSNL